MLWSLSQVTTVRQPWPDNAETNYLQMQALTDKLWTLQQRIKTKQIVYSYKFIKKTLRYKFRASGQTHVGIMFNTITVSQERPRLNYEKNSKAVVAN